MILRLSEKLSRKIRVTPTELSPLNANPFADFSCHCFTVGRDEFILAANTASLYAVVFPGEDIDQNMRFEAALYERLQRYIVGDGFEFLYKRLIDSEGGNVSYSRPLNANITASVNRLATQIESQLSTHTASPEEVAGALNGTPLPLIRHERPRDRFRTLTVQH